MSRSYLFVLISVIIAFAAFGQQPYSPLLNRPDITGLTGGTATDLDGIPTTGLAEGTMVAVFDGTETRLYRLTSGTNPESSPGVIRPDDFADPGNTKVWIASLSSDPEETGYIPSGGGGGGTTYSVGDFAQGGVVFWVDETGQHGLVCAKVDQDSGSGIRWDNGSFTDTDAHGYGIYAGAMNTMLIIADQGPKAEDYAAGLCAHYSVTESGVTYGDWYLPTEEELELMYENKATIDSTATANGGSSFACGDTSWNENMYWSSLDQYYIFGYATAKCFRIGIQGGVFKWHTLRVRAVRRF